jgi:hypothetical protein
MDECMVHLMQNEGSIPWHEKCQQSEITGQRDQDLALVTVQFIQAMKKMVQGRSFNCSEFKYN